MAIIEYYKDLSDHKDTIKIESGLTIAEALPDVENWLHYKTVCNNRFVEPDYVIQDKDILICRRIPFAISATTGILIGLTAVSVGLGIWGGVEGYKARKQAEKAEAELKKLQSQTKDEIINLPYLKGANNTRATGKTQPYFIGKNLFTPYILNAGKNYKGFSTISGTDGKDQFYNVVLEGGFNKQHLSKVYCDDIALKTWADSDSSVQEGIYSFDTSSVFSSSDSLMEIRQNGNDFTTSIFNQKIIEQQINEQLEKAESTGAYYGKSHIYTLENNSMAADVCVLFNGLRSYDSNGTAGVKSTALALEYSLDYLHLVANGDSDPEAHAEWKVAFFTVGDRTTNSFSGNTVEQLRYNAHIDFSFSEIFDSNGERLYDESISIRLRNRDKKPTSGTDVSDCYVQWVHSYCYNVKETSAELEFVPERIIGEKEAGLSTLIGLKIKSTSANEDKLKSIQVISSGVARTYNETTSQWSTTKTPTSNPAAWLLEVLTSDKHNPSKIDDSEIDLASFGDWFKFCKRKGFEVNYVITQGMTKSAIFDLILDCGRGQMFQNIYGKISVVYDDIKENAIGMINEQRLINFSYEKNLERKVDGLKVTFIDRDSDYQENTFIVMYDGSDPEERSADSVLSSITLNGITSYEQAYRKAIYLMKIERLRPKKVSAVIGEEGMFFNLLDKLLVQHPSLRIGKGNGEIKGLIVNSENKITKLELYDSVNLESVNPYSFIVQCCGDDYHTPKEIVVKGGAGITKTVELMTPLSINASVIPHKGDIFSYGLETENITEEMIITAIESNDTGYNLTLVNYNAEIVNDSETIPDYVPTFSIPRKPYSMNLTPTYQDIDNARSELTNKIDNTVMTNSPRYEVLFNTSLIKKTKDGSYSPSTITAYSRKIQGESSSVPVNGNFKMFLNGETEATPIPNYSGITDAIQINIADLLTLRNEINQVKIEFWNSTNSVLMDEETIVVLSNSAVYSVSLENNFQAFVCDNEGRVSENEIEIVPHVYYGLTEIPFGAEGWEFSSAPQKDGFTFSVDLENGKITAKTINGANIEETGNIGINLYIHSSEDVEQPIGYTDNGEDIYIGYTESGESVEMGYIEPAESGMFTTYFSFSKLSELGLLLKQETESSSPNYGDMVLDGAKIKVGSIEADKIDVNSLMAEELSVGNILKSAIYSEGSSGFKLDRNGNAELNNATIRGGLTGVFRSTNFDMANGTGFYFGNDAPSTSAKGKGYLDSVVTNSIKNWGKEKLLWIDSHGMNANGLAINQYYNILYQRATRVFSTSFNHTVRTIINSFQVLLDVSIGYDIHFIRCHGYLTYINTSNKEVKWEFNSGAYMNFTTSGNDKNLYSLYFLNYDIEGFEIENDGTNNIYSLDGDNKRTLGTFKRLFVEFY